MKFIPIEKQAPPFDTLVLVSDERKCHYSLAYNECYPPEISMTQYLELPIGMYVTLQGKGRQVYIEAPFEIKYWAEVNHD